jgi:hypothetical protein
MMPFVRVVTDKEGAGAFKQKIMAEHLTPSLEAAKGK